MIYNMDQLGQENILKEITALMHKYTEQVYRSFASRFKMI